jgi:hypothetical protein
MEFFWKFPNVFIHGDEKNKTIRRPATRKAKEPAGLLEIFGDELS